MGKIVTALKAYSDITDNVKTDYIGVIPNVDRPLEDEWHPPCVGIKDGFNPAQSEDNRENYIWFVPVEIHLYQRVSTAGDVDASLMGTTNDVGLYDLNKYVRSCLGNNDLGYVSCFATILAISDSETLYMGDAPVQHQFVTIQWEFHTT